MRAHMRKDETGISRHYLSPVTRWHATTTSMVRQRAKSLPRQLISIAKSRDGFMLRPELHPDRLVLIPFDRREGMSVSAAANLAGKSVSTIRGWCGHYGLGRRIGDGTWIVSRVALAMFLDGDREALAAYHAGDRTSMLVLQYFERIMRVPTDHTVRKQLS